MIGDRKVILVTACGGTKAYNFIRSLRLIKGFSRKFYIIGVDSSKYHMVLSQADSNILAPEVSSIDYVAVIEDIVKEEKVDLVCPMLSSEVEALVGLNGVPTFLPSEETVILCRDKYNTLSKLRDSGIVTPAILTGDSLFDSDFTLGSLWIRLRRGSGSKGAFKVDTLNQALGWMRAWESKGYEPKDFMLMPYLSGRNYAFQSLWKQGVLIGAITRERLVYEEPSSTYSVSKIIHDGQINALCYGAIQQLDNHANGVFGVDLKADVAGTPYITEINAGRFFSTSLFPSKAGYNMPYDYVLQGLSVKIIKDPYGTMTKFSLAPEGYYWIRQMDAGYKLAEAEDFEEAEKYGIC